MCKTVVRSALPFFGGEGGGGGGGGHGIPAIVISCPFFPLFLFVVVLFFHSDFIFSITYSLSSII